MKEITRQELESAKQEFADFCVAYEKKLGQCKSEMDFVGMKMALQSLREEIERWRRACS